MHDEAFNAHITTIPFRPAVRWNTRGHMLLADVVGAATIVVIFIIATKVTWSGTNLVFGIHDVILLCTFAILAIAVMAGRGHYDAGRPATLRDDVARGLVAVLAAAAGAIIVGAVYRAVDPPVIGYAVPLLAAGALAMVLLWFVARLGTHEAKTRDFAALAREHSVIVVGDGERATAFADQLKGVDRYALPSEDFTASDAGDFERALQERLEAIAPSRLVLAFDDPNEDVQTIAVQLAVKSGVAVRTLPPRTDPEAEWLMANGIEPVTALIGARERHVAWFVKSAVDRTVAALMLIILSPIMLVLALAIRLSDGGPALFGHERLGLYGVHFKAWKFRSMRTDAAERLAELLANDPAAREEWDRDQKLRNDPRVTWIGSFIRKWSLDEFPQLFNVLNGTMSLVGPRPIVEGEIERYQERFVFSRVKPGVTGLWQVSGRNDLSYDERIALDMRYAKSWSLWLDLRILLSTVPTVLLRRGAF